MKVDLTNESSYREAERIIEEAQKIGARHLALDSLRIVDLPSSLNKLTHLESLDLSDCYWLTGISELSSLKRLQSLDLSRCDQLTDITPLEKLTALQSLNLSGCNQLTDITPLEKLTALQSLDLSWCRQLTDITPLEKLTALQSLELSMCNQLTDITPLEKLTALRSLDLSYSDQLTDITPLEKLTALQSLNLSGYEQLTDITPLEKLTTLQSLDLSWCRQLTDIAPLEKLTALQSLNLSGYEQLTDITPLEKLTALQSLDLIKCNQLTDITPLEKLTALQSLNLSGCEQLTDITPLEKLTALQSLDLSMCIQQHELTELAALTNLERFNLCGTASLSNTLADAMKNLHHLRRLNISFIEDSSLIYSFPRLVSLDSDHSFYNNSQVKNTPTELFEKNLYGNALQRIINWQQDIIATGAAPNDELKLFILGNGGVGKTQIVRRLQNQVYDTTIPSTHGIKLGRCKILDAEGDHSETLLNLWDFGGQDIYLGTHGLFLDNKAIYVVAWHPDHENNHEYLENGIPMRNRPLAYWLAYIRSLAGNEATVIVVQTQCDEGDEEVLPPVPLDHGFRHLKTTACSAQTDYGIERLLPEIRAAARLLRKCYAAVQIPQNWVSVRDTLRMLRNNGTKTLSFDDFTKLCKDRSLLAHPNLMAGFLHRAGQVFWRKGAFGNNLVLDQAWALEGVYALLERKEILPMIRESYGIFNPAQLQITVWQKYKNEDHELFLDMMTQCGACFPLEKNAYVAVELLPSERLKKTEIETVWRNAEPNALVELHYEFLHDGVIKNILCCIGKEARQSGVYWRTGVCYYDQKARGAVLIQAIWEEGQTVTQRGYIKVSVEGPHAKEWVQHLVLFVESVHIGTVSQTIWRRGQKDLDTKRQQLEESKTDQVPFSSINPEMEERKLIDEIGVVETAVSSSRGQQHILLLATEWESRHGGLSTFNRELCRALASRGKIVYCVVPKATAEEIEAAEKDNVHLLETSSASLLRKLPLPENFNPDIVIGHGRITGEAAKAQHEDHYPCAKRIHFVHMAPGQIEWHKGKSDAAIQAESRERQELELIKGADLVAAVGPRLLCETSTLIDRLHPNERPRVCQFNPGFRRDETRTVPSSLHCLLVGRAEDEALKGIDIAAHALRDIEFNKLSHKPELIIRGAPEGSGTDLQKSLKKDYDGIDVRVREYTANVEEIIGDYRSAALTLLPSRSEGFGLVALESLRVGTPILISDKSGLAELLATFLKPHEQHHYIVETPDNEVHAAQNWKEKIFIQLSDVEAAIHRTNKLCAILDEQLTWSKACDQLWNDLLNC